MGIVYEAQQISLARKVALKVLSGTAALDPLKLQRFRVETQAVAQLHHPHIVPIFAVGAERGTHYYAMQYIDGTTLAEVIHQQCRFGQGPALEPEGGPASSVTGPRPPCPTSAPGEPSANGAGKEALGLSPAGLAASGTSSFLRRGAFRALARLAIQAAEALDHAHAMGILHRDIKPSNLLIDVTGNLWVTDFGLARFQDEPGLTRTGDLLGTLRYIAPELALGHRMVHDPRSDIYSLGATLYELLTLRPVFDGGNRQVLLRQIAQEEPIAPRRLEPTIPRDLETIVLKSMDKEPLRRYATAQELAFDLRRFLEDKTIRARRPTPAERASKWARRHRAVVGAAATVAFMALAIAAPLLWWEQRNTARMYHDLRLTFAQADRGFEQMIRLSDELTISGMARYAESGPSPVVKATRAAFFRQAVEFYDRLVREPRIAKAMLALAYRRLGLARMLGTQDARAEGDLRQSLTLYEELLAASPRDPELRFSIADVQMNLGIVLMGSRGMGAAEPSFRAATSVTEGLASDFAHDPTLLDQLTERRLQIAGWMETSGLRTQAERERRQLLAFYQRLAAGAAGSPSRARSTAASYHRLARALGDLGRPGEQQEVLRRGLDLEPQDPALLNDLAWSLTLRSDAPPSDSAEAIELAKRALAVNPKERALWNTLGLAHLRATHWRLAAEAIEKSIEMQSQGGDASDRLLMAMVSWRRGNKEAALEWYIRALDWLSRYPESDASVLALRAEAERLLGRAPAADARTKS
jgi:serine/threonine protein kinase/tetratricopeptide (TPR) repeat protein